MNRISIEKVGGLISVTFASFNEAGFTFVVLLFKLVHAIFAQVDIDAETIRVLLRNINSEL